MTRCEVAVFLTIAAGIHLAVFWGLSEGSPTPAGSEGTARVMMDSANPTLAALVDNWTTPPDISAAPSQHAPDTTQAPELGAALTAPANPVRPQSPDAPAAPDQTIADKPEGLPRQELQLSPTAPPIPSRAPSIDPKTPTPSGTTPRRAPAPPIAPQPPGAIDSAPSIDENSTPSVTASPRPEGRSDRTVRQPPALPPSPQTVARGRADGMQAAATPKRAKLQSLKASWGAEIAANIERRKRPISGRETGTAVIRLSVATNGTLQSARITRSSGSPVIDNAALATVQRAGRLPHAPAGLDEPSYTFDLPIRFRR